MRIEETTRPVGKCILIMSRPSLFHGDEGGTRDAYKADLGRESLSGSPSSLIICRRSDFGRRDGRAGEVGGILLFSFPDWRES